jgi:hypothetical protein
MEKCGKADIACDLLFRNDDWLTSYWSFLKGTWKA